MSLTVDNTTFASTPGAVKISVQKYLDYHGCYGLKRIFFSLILTLNPLILFRLFKWNETIYDWIVTYELFKLGCVNPSIIINREKGIIATFTDLTSSGEPTNPVIKISHQPLHLIRNMKTKNGQKISTVAVYFRNMDQAEDHVWKDFHPLIPNCFTDDIEACLACMEKISTQAWSDLEYGLLQIDDKEKEGLYHVRMSH